MHGGPDEQSQGNADEQRKGGVNGETSFDPDLTRTIRFPPPNRATGARAAEKPPPPPPSGLWSQQDREGSEPPSPFLGQGPFEMWTPPSPVFRPSPSSSGEDGPKDGPGGPRDAVTDPPAPGSTGETGTGDAGPWGLDTGALDAGVIGADPAGAGPARAGTIDDTPPTAPIGTGSSGTPFTRPDGTPSAGPAPDAVAPGPLGPPLIDPLSTPFAVPSADAFGTPFAGPLGAPFAGPGAGVPGGGAPRGPMPPEAAATEAGIPEPPPAGAAPRPAPPRATAPPSRPVRVFPPPGTPDLPPPGAPDIPLPGPPGVPPPGAPSPGTSGVPPTGAPDIPLPGSSDLRLPGAPDIPSPGSSDLPLPGAPGVPPPGLSPMPPPGATHVPPRPPGGVPVPEAAFADAATTSESLRPDRLLRTRRRPPSGGWRKVVYQATGGLVRLPDSKAERRRQELIERIRRPVAAGHFRIAVMSLKGGVGKTTTTIGLGSTLAHQRGDRVIAVDANPDRGTLSEKLRLESPATVRDLLNDRGGIWRYADVRSYTSQAPSRLEVLASDRDPAISEAFNAEDYRAVAQILEQFYSISITDCGTGMLHSAMSAILDMADQIVLVSPVTVDGARSASATLDWLQAHGHQKLARDAVVVLSAVKNTRRNPINIEELKGHFAKRCRAVIGVPFDPHLEQGAEVDLDLLRTATRDTYLEVGATIADRFSQRADA